MWCKWLISWGIWLARYGGWSEEPITAPYEEQIRQQEQAIARVMTGLRDEISTLYARTATAATVSTPVLTRAATLIRDADTTLSGGEAKRHTVYARLIKDFPGTSKRELALAIELALFHAPKEG